MTTKRKRAPKRATQTTMLAVEHSSALFYFGPTDRSGAAAYTHLIRHPNDPRETKVRGAEAREAGERAPGYQKRLGTPEEWRERIVAHLADGVPRTFNRICVELMGTTADVSFGNAPDLGLWLAVEREEIALTHEAPIFFIHPKGLAPKKPAIADDLDRQID